MALSPAQEKVKALLKDTITLLCRNGLEFDSEFRVDALIGVTLDKKNLFYISMNDTFKSTTTEEVSTEAFARRPDATPGLERRRKKRKHRQLEEDENDIAHSDDSQAANEQLANDSSQVAIKEENFVVVKQEPIEHGNTWVDTGETDVCEDPDLPTTSQYENYMDSSTGFDENTAQEAEHSFSQGEMDPFGATDQTWPSNTRVGHPQHSNTTAESTSYQPGTATSDQIAVDIPSGLAGSTLAGGEHSPMRNTYRRSNSYANIRMDAQFNLNDSDLSEDNLFKCTYCTKLFKTTASLAAHMKTCGPPEKMYTCNDCGRCFKALRYLREHTLGMHRNRRYQCRSCGEYFRFRATLASHTVKKHS